MEIPASNLSSGTVRLPETTDVLGAMNYVSARLCAELIHGVAEAADDVMQTNLRGRVVMVELGIGCDTLLKAGYSISH